MNTINYSQSVSFDIPMRAFFSEIINFTFFYDKANNDHNY